jgi:hypothetical protein
MQSLGRCTPHRTALALILLHVHSLEAQILVNLTPPALTNCTTSMTLLDIFLYIRSRAHVASVLRARLEPDFASSVLYIYRSWAIPRLRCSSFFVVNDNDGKWDGLK